MHGPDIETTSSEHGEDIHQIHILVTLSVEEDVQGAVSLGKMLSR